MSGISGTNDHDIIVHRVSPLRRPSGENRITTLPGQDSRAGAPLRLWGSKNPSDPFHPKGKVHDLIFVPHKIRRAHPWLRTVDARVRGTLTDNPILLTLGMKDPFSGVARS